MWIEDNVDTSETSALVTPLRENTRARSQQIKGGRKLDRDKERKGEMKEKSVQGRN